MKDILDTFKALSDETRLRIVKLLEHGELCVCDIGAALAMTQPKVSFHLAVLKKSGLLKDRKEGKWVHYSLDESEMFKRFLLLSVAEKVSGREVEADKARLEEFLTTKEAQTNVGSINVRQTCCAGR
jgi:ArsR family transcriptional regulator, arsenate/arsenite/antimonite-responsive transcriptional repressor